MKDRESLRRSLRHQRQNLDAEAREEKSQSIVDHFTASPVFEQATNIGLYFGVRGEVDLGEVATRAWMLGKQTFLPRVVGDNAMRFLRWTANTKLERSRWGILEPADAESFALLGLDVILVPIVGFDADGNRLGAGGGFYDRALAARPTGSSPTAVGVAYGFQQVENLTAMEWDIPMDAVITENGWIKEPQ